MIQFDEEEQNKKVKGLYEKEEEDLARMLSQKYGIGYTDLSIISINTDALRVVPENMAKESQVAAFDLLGKELKIAVFSPNQPKTKEVLDNLSKKFKLKIYMASRKSLELAWNRYKDLSFAQATKEGALDISQERVDKMVTEAQTLEDVRGYLEEVIAQEHGRQVSHVVEIILAGAIAIGASDIHLEPEEVSVRMRYRLDGLLIDVISFKNETYKYILSRIKLLAGLKLNLKNEAQDGRFSIHAGGADIEIRASSIPGEWGESVVLRVLNPKSISVPMEEIGIEPKLLALLEKEIVRPNGMILNTGPTGSGKTTTLYSFLRKIHKPEVKIITIEDPVEYHLQGIVQTQVGGEYTFSGGLRSALRQDPDVIMVGEIRDRDTAEIAVNASLTGHLVLSTLHTNNAAGTFPRLVDLGVNPKVLAPAINVVMAQRLVRKLCSKCKKEVELSSEEMELINKTLAEIKDRTLVPENPTVFEPVGCNECGGLGYSGRIGIFEIIIMNEKLEEVVGGYSSEREIKEAVKEQGFPSMLEDGILKVVRGITTLEEVGRVIDLKEESE